MRHSVWVVLGCVSLACSGSARETGALAAQEAAAPRPRKIRSWKSLNEDGIVMQSSDYSCGAAAVATLLAYEFHDAVGEAAVIDGILKSLQAAEKNDRRDNGFSLLDLSDFITARGYEASGYRLTLAELGRMRLPVLVHLSVEGDKHFAVATKSRGDQMYLADPSRGNVRMSVDAFAQEWTNVVLVVKKPGLDEAPPATEPDEDEIRDRMLSAYRAIVRERP